MIPSPNLDDRSFEEIVEEAIRLIPQYCPTWTNFNKADPGITLIELFAWMTEMAIYRLNQVPDKNYLAFLNMLGVKLQPPQPARSLVQFSLSDKVGHVRISAGTRLATKPGDDEPALTFETTRDLVAVTNRLVRCLSQHEQSYTDHTPGLSSASKPFEVFGGARSIERYIYLGDDRLAAFDEEAVLFVRFEGQGQGEQEFHDLLEWEYWDGDRWRGLVRPSLDTERNTVAFQGPAFFQPTTVDGRETHWIRGRLFEVPKNAEQTTVDTITAHLQVLGDGVPPDQALCNEEGRLFRTLDLDRRMLPFGKAPEVDAALYLCSDLVLGQKESTVQIDVTLVDPTIVDAPVPSEDLALRWEYHTGKRWKKLARVDVDGAVSSTFDFEDGTLCFTQPGSVRFRRPDDLAMTEVSGREGRWLRCRIEKGGFGVPGSYELDADTWVWRDDNPLRPPQLSGIAFKFLEEPHTVQNCVVYNDFVYSDQSQIAAAEYKPFQVFQPVAEESPTLYLGWEAPFPNDTCAIYFNVVQADRRSVYVQTPTPSAGDPLVQQRVVWEYWGGRQWSPLAPEDSTENFTQPGFVEFVGPKGARKSKRFGDNLYWMRARLEMGGYDQSPRVDRVLLNATPVDHVTTYGDTPLGSSRGTPNQFFRFPRGPVLDGEWVTVRESDKPRGDALEQLTARWGPEAVREDGDGQGWWVRWTSVESFFDQGADDRVYVKDINTGEVRFGDGVHGKIPPKGDKNVRAWRYQVGGGTAGNVPADSIIVLKQNLAFVHGVNNPYPASGGCDMESIEEAKQRAPHMIRARNRAVTVDDFEWLAREASNAVGRVKCLPSVSREGEVTVVIVPKSPIHADLGDKPLPSAELLKRVRHYLNERKLVSTRVNVVRPSYAELSLEVEFVRSRTGLTDRVRRDIERSLRRYLHPLVGGRHGRGWDFGRSVLKVDLYQVLEEVEGLEYVDRIRLRDEGMRQDVEQLKVAEDQLVFLLGVTVAEKAHDRIV